MHSTSFASPRQPEVRRSAPGSETEPRCRCGYDKNHHMVTAEPTHGVGGWLRLFIGISSRPSKITYRCRRCNEVISESTAAEALDAFY